MKNHIKIITLIFGLLICVSTHAQEEFAYAAYLSSSMTLWEKAVSNFQSKYDNSKDNESLFRLAVAQYGLLSATMKDKDEKVFDRHVDEAMENLETCENKGFKVAESQAILSAIYGLKIAYTPWKGMFWGPKSSNLIESAMKSDPKSALVQKLYGNNKLFTPSNWGGDVKQAIASYEKAIQLYQEDNDTASNWMYIDTFAWLGQAYEKESKIKEAITTYEEGLEVEKDFHWIKSALLPAAKSK